MRKLQDQNEMYQASRAKMAEELAMALEKKDQEWMGKLTNLEEEKTQLSDQVLTMKKQSLSLFQKREDLDELEGFQQQEMAKIKHMLLKKEELLRESAEDLEQQRTEAESAQAKLQESQRLMTNLTDDLHKLQEENVELSQQRLELAAAREGAEKKITELEQRQQELQDYIQRLSIDLQKAQSAASSSERRLNEIQEHYEALKLQHEQLKSKMAVEVEQKDVLIVRLQEKVGSLEKTLEGSLSGEEGLQELLKERDALEMRLDETRQQLLETRTLHTDTVSELESQAAKLNSRLQEAQGLVQEKESDFILFKDESSVKQSEFKSETSKLTQQLHSTRQQSAEKVERLEAQVSALESAREIDRTASQHHISQLEQENESLKEKMKDAEAALKKQEVDQEKMKEELSSRETVSVEIAKALEETRKQKEDLQLQVAELSVVIERNTQEISLKCDELTKKDEEASRLKGDYDDIVLQMQQLQTDLDTFKARATQSEEAADKRVNAVRVQLQEQEAALLASESQVSSLQEEVSTLHKCLHGTTTPESNGEVTVGDIAQLQKENREMEQQIAEKNKTIKQLQQRMAELKKTLQKELKLKPELEITDVRERVTSEPTAPALTVTNNSDLNDSREINFEYLKHVVLKFMSAREAEAFHLIKAVSVLLNFSVEEENLLKETLEYKMSWFGSKPAPKGTVRPSISKPRTPWS